MKFENQNSNVNLNMKTLYILTYTNSGIYNMNIKGFLNKFIITFSNSSGTYYDIVGINGANSSVYSSTLNVNEFSENLKDSLSFLASYKMNFESDLLKEICSSYNFRYYIYFTKIEIELYNLYVDSLTENNVLYYSSEDDNKNLVEFNKNYDFETSNFYIKSSIPGLIRVYYLFNLFYDCTTIYETSVTSNENSDKHFSFINGIEINVKGCNENCEECFENEGINYCSKCNDGYYPVKNYTNYCFDTLNGYILKDGYWEQCFYGCETCDKSMEEIKKEEDFDFINSNMQCNSCAENYVFMKESQCYSPHDIFYYHLDEEEEEEEKEEDEEEKKEEEEEKEE